MKFNTGIKGRKNYVILNNVLGQMSDGIWENDSEIQKIWCDLMLSFYNDQVFIECGRHTSNIFRSSAELLRFLADMVHKTISYEKEDNLLMHVKYNEDLRKIRWGNYKDITLYLSNDEQEFTTEDCFKLYENLMKISESTHKTLLY